jgi:hypothetical protein
VVAIAIGVRFKNKRRLCIYTPLNSSSDSVLYWNAFFKNMSSRYNKRRRARAPELPPSTPIQQPQEIADFFLAYGEASPWRARLTMQFEPAPGTYEDFGFAITLYKDGTVARPRVAGHRNLCRELFDDAQKEIRKRICTEREKAQQEAIRSLQPPGTPVTAAQIDAFMKRAQQTVSQCVAVDIQYTGSMFEVTIRHTCTPAQVVREKRMAQQRYLCKELLDEAQASIVEWEWELALQKAKKDAPVLPRSIVPDMLSTFMWKYPGAGRWRAELAMEADGARAPPADDAASGFAIYMCDGEDGGRRHRVAWNAQLCAQLFADAERGISDL